MTSRRHLISGLWVVCLAGAGIGRAEAQGATATVRVNLPVTEPIIRLHISTASTGFGTVGFTELGAGFRDRDGPVLQVKSNRPFAVQIGAAALTFDSGVKPSAEVYWARTPGGPFTSLSTAGVTVLSQAAGGVTGQPVYFRMLWSLASDPPGTYALEVTFTAAPP